MRTSEISRWYLVTSPEGYVAIERASCAIEAARIAAAKRPGYEGCSAAEYHSAHEEQIQNERYEKMEEQLRFIQQCLTKLN